MPGSRFGPSSPSQLSEGDSLPSSMTFSFAEAASAPEDVFRVLLHPVFNAEAERGRFLAMNFLRTRMSLILELAISDTEMLCAKYSRLSTGEAHALSLVALKALCGRTALNREGTLQAYSASCGPIWDSKTTRDFFSTRRDFVEQVCETLYDACERLEEVVPAAVRGRLGSYVSTPASSSTSDGRGTAAAAATIVTTVTHHVHEGQPSTRQVKEKANTEMKAEEEGTESLEDAVEEGDGDEQVTYMTCRSGDTSTSVSTAASASRGMTGRESQGGDAPCLPSSPPSSTLRLCELENNQAIATNPFFSSLRGHHKLTLAELPAYLDRYCSIIQALLLLTESMLVASVMCKDTFSVLPSPTSLVHSSASSDDNDGILGGGHSGCLSSRFLGSGRNALYGSSFGTSSTGDKMGCSGGDDDGDADSSDDALRFMVKHAIRAFTHTFLSMTTVQQQLAHYSNHHAQHHGLCILNLKPQSSGRGDSEAVDPAATVELVSSLASAVACVNASLHSGRATAVGSFAGDCEVCERFRVVECEMSRSVEASMHVLKLAAVAFAAHDEAIAETAIEYIDSRGPNFTAQATMLLAHVLTPDVLAAHPATSRGGRALQWILSFVFGGCDHADVERRRQQRRRSRLRHNNSSSSSGIYSLNNSNSSNSDRRTTPTVSSSSTSPASSRGVGGIRDEDEAEFQLRQEAEERQEAGVFPSPIPQATCLRVEYILASCFTRCHPLMTVIGVVAESDAYSCGITVAKAVLQYGFTLSQTSVRLMGTPVLNTMWLTPFTEAMMKGLNELANLKEGGGGPALHVTPVSSSDNSSWATSSSESDNENDGDALQHVNKTSASRPDKRKERRESSREQGEHTEGKSDGRSRVETLSKGSSLEAALAANSKANRQKMGSTPPLHNFGSASDRPLQPQEFQHGTPDGLPSRRRHYRFRYHPVGEITGTSAAEAAESASSRTERRCLALHWGKCVLLSGRTLGKAGITKVAVPREHYHNLHRVSKQLQVLLREEYEEKQAAAPTSPLGSAQAHRFHTTTKSASSSSALRVSPAVEDDVTTTTTGSNSSPTAASARGAVLRGNETSGHRVIGPFGIPERMPVMTSLVCLESAKPFSQREDSAKYILHARLPPAMTTSDISVSEGSAAWASQDLPILTTMATTAVNTVARKGGPGSSSSSPQQQQHHRLLVPVRSTTAQERVLDSGPNDRSENVIDSEASDLLFNQHPLYSRSDVNSGSDGTGCSGGLHHQHRYITNGAAPNFANSIRNERISSSPNNFLNPPAPKSNASSCAAHRPPAKLKETYRRAFMDCFGFGQPSTELSASTPYVTVPVHEIVFASLFKIFSAAGDVLLCEKPRLNSTFVNELTTLLYELRLGMFEMKSSMELMTSQEHRFRSLADSMLNDKDDTALDEPLDTPYQLLFPEEYSVILTKALRISKVIERWQTDIKHDPNHPGIGHLSLLQHLKRRLERREWPSNREFLVSRGTLRLLLGVTARDEAGNVHGNTLYVDDLDLEGIRKEHVAPRLGVLSSKDVVSSDDVFGMAAAGATPTTTARSSRLAPIDVASLDVDETSTVASSRAHSIIRTASKVDRGGDGGGGGHTSTCSAPTSEDSNALQAGDISRPSLAPSYMHHPLSGINRCGDLTVETWRDEDASFIEGGYLERRTSFMVGDEESGEADSDGSTGESSPTDPTSYGQQQQKEDSGGDRSSDSDKHEVKQKGGTLSPNVDEEDRPSSFDHCSHGGSFQDSSPVRSPNHNMLPPLYYQHMKSQRPAPLDAPSPTAVSTPASLHHHHHPSSQKEWEHQQEKLRGQQKQWIRLVGTAKELRTILERSTGNWRVAAPDDVIQKQLNESATSTAAAAVGEEAEGVNTSETNNDNTVKKTKGFPSTEIGMRDSAMSTTTGNGHDNNNNSTGGQCESTDSGASDFTTKSPVMLVLSAPLLRAPAPVSPTSSTEHAASLKRTFSLAVDGSTGTCADAKDAEPPLAEWQLQTLHSLSVPPAVLSPPLPPPSSASTVAATTAAGMSAAVVDASGDVLRRPLRQTSAKHTRSGTATSKRSEKMAGQHPPQLPPLPPPASSTPAAALSAAQIKKSKLRTLRERLPNTMRLIATGAFGPVDGNKSFSFLRCHVHFEEEAEEEEQEENKSAAGDGMDRSPRTGKLDAGASPKTTAAACSISPTTSLPSSSKAAHARKPRTSPPPHASSTPTSPVCSCFGSPQLSYQRLLARNNDGSAASTQQAKPVHHHHSTSPLTPASPVFVHYRTSSELAAASDEHRATLAGSSPSSMQEACLRERADHGACHHEQQQAASECEEDAVRGDERCSASSNMMLARTPPCVSGQGGDKDLPNSARSDLST